MCHIIQNKAKWHKTHNIFKNFGYSQVRTCCRTVWGSSTWWDSHTEVVYSPVRLEPYAPLSRFPMLPICIWYVLRIYGRSYTLSKARSVTWESFKGSTLPGVWAPRGFGGARWGAFRPLSPANGGVCRLHPWSAPSQYGRRMNLFCACQSQGIQGRVSGWVPSHACGQLLFRSTETAASALQRLNEILPLESPGDKSGRRVNAEFIKHTLA